MPRHTNCCDRGAYAFHRQFYSYRRQTPMDASYFRALAARCLTAARNSFDLRAVEEFRKLAEEFTLKADELDRLKQR
jgi:hypothetical protein